MKYSVYVRCGCRGPEGKLIGQDCPQLWRKDKTGRPAVGKDGDPVWVGSRHGTAGWAGRVPTSGGVKLVRRLGHNTKTEAEQAAQHAGKLLGLATDDTTRNRIGDLIAGIKNGTPLPSVEDVARRIGVGLDPTTTGITVGEAWHGWLAGKKRLRASSHERLEVAGKHWILPVLAEVPLERLNGAHVAQVFVRMERITTEIIAQLGSGRAYVRVEGDVRTRPRPVGVASQHRVYAALREFCNFEMRKTRRLSFNPVYAVELEPEVTPEGKRWSVAQTLAFLSATEGDPLGLLFRIVLLCGARRGEAVGLRWSDVDLDAGIAEVRHTLVTVGKGVVSGTPKTKAGRRIYGLDAKTVALLKEHRKAQLKTRLKAGEAWADNDLVFCRDDGTPYKPDAVTRRFKRVAALAGLPVIKLHEGRHTNASLQRDAAVDPEIRRKSLGHADAAMTSHYTHIEAEAYRQATEAVAKLVEGAGS